jgi:8-oxo-dGTP diphosphatase
MLSLHPAINKRFCLPVAAYLVVKQEDKVLLLKRLNTGFYDGHWSLIAGCLDGNESVVDAVIREAKEEASIEVNREDLSTPTVLHRKGNDEMWEALIFFFVTTNYKGVIKNNEPDKCESLDFFSLDALPSNMIPYVKTGLHAALKGISFLEYGW